MIIPIRCFNCGQILASKYKKYQKLINSLVLVELYDKDGPSLYVPEELEKGSWSQEEEVTIQDRKKVIDDLMTHIDTEHRQLAQHDHEPIDTSVIDGNNNKEAIILDQLGLKRYCCRTFMMSHLPLLEKF